MVRRWSHRAGWGQPHVLAVTGGAVIAAGCFAFLTTPIGEVSDIKYGHTIVLLAGVALLSLVAAGRAETPRFRAGSR